MISGDGIDDEDGELKGKDEREFRTHAEHEKNRITWNVERRHFLDSGSSKMCV